MMSVMEGVWLAAVALFSFLEAATLALVSVWFAAGALAATFAAYGAVDLTSQLLIFVGVSLVAFAAVRPLAKRFLEPRFVPTNADRLLGAEARVTEVICNSNATGAVYLDGKTWSARSANGTDIPVGALVKVERMEGVKLIVQMRAAVSVS